MFVILLHMHTCSKYLANLQADLQKGQVCLCIHLCIKMFPLSVYKIVHECGLDGTSEKHLIQSAAHHRAGSRFGSGYSGPWLAKSQKTLNIIQHFEMFNRA